MSGSTVTANHPSHQHPLGMGHLEMDAARALLGVSPGSVVDVAESYARSGSPLDGEDALPLSPQEESPAEESQTLSNDTESTEELADTSEAPIIRRPRSDSAGLDALAALAYQEQASMELGKGSSSRSTTAVVLKHAHHHHHHRAGKPGCSSSAVTSSSSSSCAESSSEDDEDCSNMPPPPPRRRPRSASNPEGMEKWESLRRAGVVAIEGDDDISCRRHFVLPASILEVELAEASAAVQEQRRHRCVSIPEEPECTNDHGRKQSRHYKNKVTAADDSHEDVDEDDEVDETSLTPDELLRRARSRLLEDLSQGSVNGEKGVLTLPHALAKYKEVYNQNGRIGIYTPAEREAIIARFQRKRTRRVWNKKIRYGCRKNLADRRLRVKGRFVKRSEQEQLAKQLAEQEANDKADTGNNKETAELPDEDMPDVNDPEAGFAPTEDQPYRRLRRFTIT